MLKLLKRLWNRYRGMHTVESSVPAASWERCAAILKPSFRPGTVFTFGPANLGDLQKAHYISSQMANYHVSPFGK